MTAQQSAYFRAGSVRKSTADSRIVVHVLPDRNALRNPLRNMYQPLAVIKKHSL